MKAIIPVAGVGTRLRPHTFTQPKPLIPVAGKPIIFFIIDQLIDAGVNDFVFIIGHLGDKIELEIEEVYIQREIPGQENGISHMYVNVYFQKTANVEILELVIQDNAHLAHPCR